MRRASGARGSSLRAWKLGHPVFLPRAISNREYFGRRSIIPFSRQCFRESLDRSACVDPGIRVTRRPALTVQLGSPATPPGSFPPRVVVSFLATPLSTFLRSRLCLSNASRYSSFDETRENLGCLNMVRTRLKMRKVSNRFWITLTRMNRLLQVAG